MHPDDQRLLSMQWQGNTFIGWALPFGLQSSPKIFNAMADFLARVLHCEGVPFVLQYLDDFRLFKPPGFDTVYTVRSHVESILGCIGAPIAQQKTDQPSTKLSFLGIQIDTNQFQLSLPDAKIEHLQNLLQHWNTQILQKTGP